MVVVGAGGLGCSVLPLLAARGCHVTLFDDDVVSLSNLQRQLLFRTEDVGRAKVEVAKERILSMFPSARIEAMRERLTPETIRREVEEASVVVDGSDNLPTRFLVNDACVLAGRPLVHGGILRFLGQVLVVLPGTSCCYRCLFEELPPAGSVPSCAEAGVLGALCGIVGARMAEETARILAGRGVGDRLWTHDARSGRTRWVPLARDGGCAVCGAAPSITSLEAPRYVEEACAR